MRPGGSIPITHITIAPGPGPQMWGDPQDESQTPGSSALQPSANPASASGQPAPVPWHHVAPGSDAVQQRLQRGSAVGGNVGVKRTHEESDPEEATSTKKHRQTTLVPSETHGGAALPNHLADIPPEILAAIADYLPLQGLQSLACTSKSLHDFVTAYLDKYVEQYKMLDVDELRHIADRFAERRFEDRLAMLDVNAIAQIANRNAIEMIEHEMRKLDLETLFRGHSIAAADLTLIGPSKTSLVIDALIGSSTLKKLHLNAPKQTLPRIYDLEKLFQHPTLKKLSFNLSRTGLPPPLAKKMFWNPNIEHLNIGWCGDNLKPTVFHVTPEEIEKFNGESSLGTRNIGGIPLDTKALVNIAGMRLSKLFLSVGSGEKVVDGLAKLSQSPWLVHLVFEDSRVKPEYLAPFMKNDALKSLRIEFWGGQGPQGELKKTELENAYGSQCDNCLFALSVEAEPGRIAKIMFTRK